MELAGGECIRDPWGIGFATIARAAKSSVNTEKQPFSFEKLERVQKRSRTKNEHG